MDLNIKTALFCGKIAAKQTLHLDVSSPDDKIGIMFDGMGKNIQGMKPAVSNKYGGYARNRLIPVKQRAECPELVFLPDWLNHTIGIPFREKIKKRDHMNLVIAISGFSIRVKIRIWIQRIDGKGKRRSVCRKKLIPVLV